MAKQGETADKRALARIITESGSVTAAATYLGVHRATLHRAMAGGRVATWVAARIRGPVPPVPVEEGRQ